MADGGWYVSVNSCEDSRSNFKAQILTPYFCPALRIKGTDLGTRVGAMDLWGHVLYIGCGWRATLQADPKLPFYMRHCAPSLVKSIFPHKWPLMVTPCPRADGP